MAEPLRSCTVCRTKIGKSNLYRFVWDGEKPVLDKQQNLDGRGAYSCRSDKCVDKFLSQEQRWRKVFKK